MATLGAAGAAHEVLVVAGHAHIKHPALHRDGLHAAVVLYEGVLQVNPFAKYAVTFPRISRSIFIRASSARSLLISICSALTGLLSTPKSLPSRWALTQLKSVCLLDHPQCSGRRRYALPAMHQSDRLLLKLERVPCP